MQVSARAFSIALFAAFMVAACALFLFQIESSDPRDTADPEVAADDAHDVTTLAAGATSRTEGHVASRRANDVLDDLDPEQAAALGVRVEGTVRFEDGSRVRSGGVLSLEATGESPVQAEVEKGRFVAWLPATGEVRVTALTLSDEICPPSCLKKSTFAAGEPLDLEILSRVAPLVCIRGPDGAPRPDAVVYVLDRGSEVGTEVVSRPALRGAWEPAGGALRVRTDGTVELPPSWTDVEVLAGAPGLAWAWAQVPPRNQGDNSITLSAAGRVVARVEGPVPSGAVVVVWNVLGACPESQIPLPPVGPLVLEAVPVGLWGLEVRYEGMSPNADKAVAEVDVGDGSTSDVVLVPRPPKPQAVGVTGTVWMDESWGLERATIHFKGSEPATKFRETSSPLEDRRGGRFVFEVTGLVSGAYWVSIPEVSFFTPIQVPRGGGPLDLRVPKACRVEVAILEVGSERAVSGGTVHWMAGTGVHLGLLPGVCELRIPEGQRGSFWVDVEGYGFGNTVFDAPQSSSQPIRVVIFVEPCSGIRFNLVGAPPGRSISVGVLPVNAREAPAPGPQPAPKALPFSGVAPGWMRVNAGRYLYGAYEPLRPTDLPDREIEVFPGQTSEVSIPWPER